MHQAYHRTAVCRSTKQLHNCTRERGVSELRKSLTSCPIGRIDCRPAIHTLSMQQDCSGQVVSHHEHGVIGKQ
jgi:hypothetical protein